MGSSFVFKGVMNLIESKFSLELTKGGVQRVVFAKSGERGSRVVLITLTEAGKVFDASPYRLRVNFDSGESVSSTVTFEQGCVRFEIPEGALVAPGEKLCELQISNDTRLIYAPVFKIVVEQSIGQQNTEDIQFNESVRYQESIPNLNVGKNVTLNDEVALFDGEDTTRNKLSALPFVTEETYDQYIQEQAEVNKIVGANAIAKHTHDNKQVLDKLGAEGDKLTFGGTPVGGGQPEAEKPSLTLKEAVLDMNEAHVHADTTNVITFEASVVPANARVKKVEIPDIVNGTGEYISLEDMVSKDPNGLVSPYYVMYINSMLGSYLPNVVAAVVYTSIPGSFYDLVSQTGFFGQIIKIYYEIEE